MKKSKYIGRLIKIRNDVVISLVYNSNKLGIIVNRLSSKEFIVFINRPVLWTAQPKELCK